MENQNVHSFNKNLIKNNILYGKLEEFHHINIGDMILNTLKSRLDFIGQIDAQTEEQVTFQQMRENSVRCALWLQKRGFGNGDRIAICTRNQMIAYIPFLASIYIGVTIVPWDHKYLTYDRIRPMFFLTTHEPKIIFIDEDIVLHLTLSLRFLQQSGTSIKPEIIVLGKLGNFYSLDSILNDNRLEIEEFSCVNVDLQAVMILMFNPEATTYINNKTHIRHFAFTYPSNQEVPTMFPGDIGLWYGSLHCAHGALLTVRCIISHVTAIKNSKFSEINLFETIEKYKVSWVFLDTYMVNQLHQIDLTIKYDFSSLREFVYGNLMTTNDILSELIKSLPNVSIIRIYNAAEINVICAYLRYSENEPHYTCGYVSKNIVMKFIDRETKEIIGPLRLGEPWYKLLYPSCNFDGDKCMFPNCTNDKRKRDNLPKEDATIWKCTFDFGLYDTNGRIIVSDKTIDTIKYKGLIASLRIIEDMLLCHPAVSEAVVVSVPHKTDGQYPRAYVKKFDGEDQVTAEELISFVNEQIERDCNKLRGGLFFKSNMPYLPNGKIDRILVQRSLIDISDFLNRINLGS